MRLFVGIGLPDDVSDAVAGLALPSASLARCTSPQDLHLTLHFLGETSPADTDRLRFSLRSVRCHCFELQLSGAGSFGTRGRPEILWIGIAPNPALLVLQQTVGEAVLAAGMAVEQRPYVPHLTVARMKRPSPVATADFVRENQSFRSRFRVMQFALYCSHPDGGRVRYQVIEEFPLQES